MRGAEAARELLKKAKQSPQVSPTQTERRDATTRSLPTERHPDIQEFSKRGREQHIDCGVAGSTKKI